MADKSFIPGTILELADRLGARMEVIQYPEVNKERDYKHLRSAKLELKKANNVVKLDLLYNEVNMREYMPMEIYFQDYVFSEDDYPEEMLEIVGNLLSGNFEEKRIGLLKKKSLVVLDRDGNEKYWPRG